MAAARAGIEKRFGRHTFFRHTYSTMLVANGENMKVRLHWHDLRHTFGTKLGDAGYAESTIAQLMGDASVELAFRYTHATEGGKEVAVEAARIGRSGLCHDPATNDQRPVLLAAVG